MENLRDRGFGGHSPRDIGLARRGDSKKTTPDLATLGPIDSQTAKFGGALCSCRPTPIINRSSQVSHRRYVPVASCDSIEERIWRST